MEYIKQRSRLSKISIEDLLDAANSPEELTKTVEVSGDNSNIPSFIMAYSIKPGEYPVTSRLLYELYRAWTKNPLTKVMFSLVLGKFIVNENGYFYIDRPALKVSQEVERHLLKSTRSAIKVKSYKKHFENYLRKYSITVGTYYIESYILYYLYDKWVYGINKKQPLGQNQFTSLCQLYFKSKRNSKSRVMWFGIDRSKLLQVITIQQLVNIRKGRKQRYGRPKKQPKK